MQLSDKLLAWIAPRSETEFVAAFVGGAAVSGRAPATRLCPSHSEARQWVEDQAAALGLPVEWLSGAPG
jgi:hypothetical protein